MTRKEKLKQAPKIADLWYQQQKERRGVAWRQKSDLSRQTNSRIQNYTRKILTQKRGFVNES